MNPRKSILLPWRKKSDKTHRCLEQRYTSSIRVWFLNWTVNCEKRWICKKNSFRRTSFRIQIIFEMDFSNRIHMILDQDSDKCRKTLDLFGLRNIALKRNLGLKTSSRGNFEPETRTKMFRLRHNFQFLLLGEFWTLG